MSLSPQPQHSVQSQPDLNLYHLAERIYNLGDFLLWDDRFDIGYGAYRNRPHIYHGKLERDHPSVWHHWPIGIFLMAIGQSLGTIATFNDMKNATQEESFNNELVDYSSR